MAFAQSPTPTISKTGGATSSPPPGLEDAVNSLGETDLQAAVSFAKSNFANPDALNETELNRAMLEGLVIRQPNGFALLAGPDPTAPEVNLYSELLEGHIGYLRVGSLTNANLKATDHKLSEFAAKTSDAIILDLRASSQPNDFAMAAEFAKRFCPKGKTLFTVHKAAARQDRSFSSDRDPSFQGLIVVLADGETTGAAEAIAAALRIYDRALIIGQPTSGRAAEYSDLPLPGGKILRVASAVAVMPDNQPIFPEGVKPDLPVSMSMSDKHQIFQLSTEKGVAQFLYETERPHLNEAALLSGANPELDAAEARRSPAKAKQPSHDPILQRALDVLTSLEIYQKR